MKLKIVSVLACTLFFALTTSAQNKNSTAKRHYDVAAFLYPAYASDDPRLRPFWPSGIGEWETVTSVQERFPGFYWNRKPLWGTINEADSAVMSMEINQAVDHGVNVFIFDWYWYDGRPFMETTLDNGFLKAGNRDKMKFYLMWANHDVVNVWDTRLNKYNENNVIWTGRVDRNEFERICKRDIDKYFKSPQYYKINGKPVFMIYDLPNLINGLGGLQQTIDALKWFREETKKAGFPGLDLQFTMWGANFNFSGVDADKGEKPQNAVLQKLGFTSATHYQFAHFLNVNDDYLNILEQMKKEWAKIDAEFDIPYYPHISVGWDNSPRTGKSAVVRNNTPENFEKALRMAKDYADAHPKQVPLITINSWNEWTETSYLQPDNVNGYGYLEAIKKVFLLQ
ncbi:glycoside hydrolase family 99-like domain-containing protein [Mucilaginibacter sp. dw_454]|uniref:glycosyltransferase WbsX family protein n=1 Tax=Mucilaginibacter sp. dw_454 TaxID=2720079 RepID=UPI001BD5F806|nr:glycoside hydrolase family 99-like domain-containing protein [Mucilaginibacter sp. dw_454]